MKKILVTGGSGFLGSHLTKKLIEDGNFVYCMDNNYTGSINNVSDLKDKPNFKFIEKDIRDDIDLEVDEIYNLACPASPPHYQKDPIYTIDTCYTGTMKLLDLAVKNKAKFLQASTSEVYGDPKVHPQNEEYWGNVNPIGIRSCYDEGKRIVETLCIEYARKYNIDYKIMRIFNTYGPNMDPKDGRVVSNFIMQSLRGDDITIYGDGTQTRSFCYVDDNINGMILLMNSAADIHGPINIGNPNEFTIKELAEKVIELTGTKSKIVYHDLPQDDPLLRQPDITKAKEQLNWKPTIELEEGLKKTIPYFQNLL
jgi:UDP-glucuronate decarboxylase